MGKLQPNFSWQKYEGKPEDQKQQFQYQLQTQHIQVANSVNTIIDDESYFTAERQTNFTWIDSRPIWRKTITGLIVGAAITPYLHGITGIRTLVNVIATAQNAVPMTTVGFTLPFVDPATPANNIGIYVNTTQVVITTGNAAFNGYTFYVTIEYTK
jgi:hypothetical protein